jgi:hypothetical protein
LADESAEGVDAPKAIEALPTAIPITQTKLCKVLNTLTPLQSACQESLTSRTASPI